jgi:hypothetical protein
MDGAAVETETGHRARLRERDREDSGKGLSTNRHRV